MGGVVSVSAVHGNGFAKCPFGGASLQSRPSGFTPSAAYDALVLVLDHAMGLEM